MFSILAFVGLAFIIWYVSKGLKRFGRWCDVVAEAMVDRSVSATRIQCRNTKSLKYTREKIKKFKNDCDDKEFNDRIRKEIDELTGGEEL